MKNVYTSWDINLLSDKMIEKITESWKTPFNSPVVIFTDPKTEQWFKLRWLKNQNTGKSVLLNLKTQRIQQFLFDLVTPQSLFEQQPEKLSVEMLRDIIITKLTSKTAGEEFYFETLNSDQISNYLFGDSKTRSINANHLYDFAQTIASLFLDYEDTRPDSLDKLLELEAWQKKLYEDIISEEGIQVANTKYLTLYQLVKLNKKNNAGKLSFNWNKEKPVFIFGFSGLGQIYRSILEDFSKENRLEVFLQLADAGEPEKAQNQLLKSWSNFGHKQLSLWCKEAQVTPLATDMATQAEDSLLHRTQKAIVNNEKITAISFTRQTEKDNSITLTSAPNAVREVEALHTKICKLLENKNTQLGDILVVAPNIQNYKTAIEQVFDQNDLMNPDSVFPNIPYTIADYSGERSLTAEALQVLFGIWRKKYLSRSDLFSLLHNYLVQTVCNISDDDVLDWSEWASSLNVFRDRKNKKDWEKAKNRLLLSRLTTNLIQPEGKTEAYLPFETISTADDNSLYKFIDMIDKLEEWEAFSSKAKFNAEDIDRLRTLLEGWLLLGDKATDDLYNESLVFQNVIEEIERQKLTAEPDVFMEAFTNGLLDRSHAVTLHSSNILGRGITFANFESNRVLSAKYVFFIGIDSKVFPGSENQNELDLRTSPEAEQDIGDESSVEKNKNAFLCQLMAAGQGFFLSFINKDLQKDEEFFKSSVLEDLFNTIYLKEKNEDESLVYESKIKIDETRPWKELYTQREFRNKQNFLQLQTSQEKQESPDNNKSCKDCVFYKFLHEEENENLEADKKLPDRVSLSQIKNFLTDPFIFMASQKFNKNEDDANEENQELEPLFFDTITNSMLRKQAVKTDLQQEAEKADELTETTIANGNLRKELENQNILPDDFFGTAALQSIEEQRDQILETIKNGGFLPEDKAFVLDDSRNILIRKQEPFTSNDWYLNGELAWHIIDGRSIYFVELNNQDNCLSGYVSALALLADLPESENKVQYDISLYVISSKEDEDPPEAKSFSATPEVARFILNKLYNKMFTAHCCKCVPYGILKDDPKKTTTLSGLTYELEKDHGKTSWKYFNKADLFDKNEHIGYSTKNFANEWPIACECQMSDILFLHNDIDNNNSNENEEN